MAFFRCRGWEEAAARGSARESTGSGRLVVVRDDRTGGVGYVDACPWCGKVLYRLVRGVRVPTSAGRAHREMVRRARGD